MIVLLAAMLTAAWLTVLVAAPMFPGWAGAIVYGVGSLICHQIPERSFYLAGFQLPVCARCLGIYTGAAAGAAFVLMRSRSGNLFPAVPAASRWLAVVASAPTLVTVALEAVGMWDPSNLTRALAGFALGGILAFVVVSALATLHYGECAPPRPTAPKPPPRSI